jgi:signal transduction histidine kinase
VNRLNKTIHSLIEILDIQNREKRISRELEFKTVLQEAIDEYNDLIMETGAEIRADFSAALRISYVEGYLSSIFHNLLSNSLKYRRPGEKPVISILTKPVPGGIVLSFSDNGIGMDMQRVKGKLFTPFTRFSLQAEGKGIGLYLVKGMVESNGGKVEVDSELGEGTKFSFKLIPY